MTDLATREGVSSITTFDETMMSRVTRFGFEYEMFPYNYRARARRNPDPMPDDLVVPDGHPGCVCSPECVGARRRDYWDSLAVHPAPFMSGDTLVQRAFERGLTANDTRHPYHCRCADVCGPHRGKPLMCAQTDSSVWVEFVSRILDTNDLDPAEVNAWITLMEEWKSDGGWMPDGVTSCGNHVHVSKSGTDSGGRLFDSYEQDAASNNIIALFAAYDWRYVADGGCGKIRDYNSKPEPGGYSGGYLSDRGYGTMEHRLWNTPRDPQRLWAHLGISVGLTRWAFGLAVNGVRLPSCYNLTTATVKELHKGIEPIKETIARYIPAGDHFDIARDVLGNLAPMK